MKYEGKLPQEVGLIPLVVSTFGAWEDNANMCETVSHQGRNSAVNSNSLKKQFFQRLSVCLQRLSKLRPNWTYWPLMGPLSALSVVAAHALSLPDFPTCPFCVLPSCSLSGWPLSGFAVSLPPVFLRSPFLPLSSFLPGVCPMLPCDLLFDQLVAEVILSLSLSLSLSC